MEKYKKGGYTILDLESSTIYADSVKALDSNKPIVVYDGTYKPYFADTITKSGTNIIITKGGKTITIANDNTITSEGDIQNHLYKCYAISQYLQTSGNDYRGTFIIDINEIPENPNYNTFNDIKTYLSNLLDKCGVINIVQSDGDTTFNGTITKNNDKIFIDGYLENDGYVHVDFDTFENDNSLELSFIWDTIKLF